MNPLIQGKSGTTPVSSRNAFSTNQGTNEDDSQSDPHPEAGVFGNQTMRNSGQKDRRDSMKIYEWLSFQRLCFATFKSTIYTFFFFHFFDYFNFTKCERFKHCTKWNNYNSIGITKCVLSVELTFEHFHHLQFTRVDHRSVKSEFILIFLISSSSLLVILIDFPWNIWPERCWVLLFLVTVFSKKEPTIFETFSIWKRQKV